jgi:hypothetical protein
VRCVRPRRLQQKDIRPGSVHLDALKSRSEARPLMLHHAPDRPPHHSRPVQSHVNISIFLNLEILDRGRRESGRIRRAEVVRAEGWVGVHFLAENGHVEQLVSDEGAANIHLLASHQHHPLPGLHLHENTFQRPLPRVVTELNILPCTFVAGNFSTGGGWRE